VCQLLVRLIIFSMLTIVHATSYQKQVQYQHQYYLLLIDFTSPTIKVDIIDAIKGKVGVEEGGAEGAVEGDG